MAMQSDKAAKGAGAGARAGGAKRGRPALLAAAAAVVVALAVAVTHHSAPSGPPQLQPAPRAELAALTVTLDPAHATQMAADAQSCKVPMAEVKLWHDAGAADSVIQLRSGGYVSPAFRLTTTPQLIAVPYPAAYSVGAGTFTLLGQAQAVEFSLNPVTAFANLNGAASINVVWTPGNPCQ
jgi:hypothetical protein